MPDPHIAVARDVDRYAAHRMAAAAAAKAKRMWPDVIGDVLADEIMAMLDLPSWLRSQTRTQRLIDAILGKDWIGLAPALTVDWALWTVGTAFGLITTVWIPFRMMTTHDIKPDSAFAGWLMPVVPPMVSAANGALLIAYLPEGQIRLGC